jgi:hypothetical protein
MILTMIDISKILPLIPVETDISVAYAMQALYRGEATAEQQEKAMNWIIERASRAYMPSYISEKVNDTIFNEGKRAVGLQIIQLVNANLATIKEAIK